jgi:mono/diheme cytochrome c family protein
MRSASTFLARSIIPAALAVLACGMCPPTRMSWAHVVSPQLRDTTALTAQRGRADTDSLRTTMDGVYTLAQATRGSNVFAAYCKSCHTPTFHSGPPFRAKWYGRPLGDLYSYIKREMPKNAPGSMSDADYTLAIAYLLRINGMPTGVKPLAADSVELHRIRLDSVPASSSHEGS